MILKEFVAFVVLLVAAAIRRLSFELLGLRFRLRLLALEAESPAFERVTSGVGVDMMRVE